MMINKENKYDKLPHSSTGSDSPTGSGQLQFLLIHNFKNDVAASRAFWASISRHFGF